MKTLLLAVTVIMMTGCASIKSALNIDPEEVDALQSAFGRYTSHITEKWNEYSVQEKEEARAKLAEKVEKARVKIEELKGEI